MAENRLCRKMIAMIRVMGMSSKQITQIEKFLSGKFLFGIRWNPIEPPFGLSRPTGYICLASAVFNLTFWFAGHWGLRLWRTVPDVLRLCQLLPSNICPCSSISVRPNCAHPCAIIYLGRMITHLLMQSTRGLSAQHTWNVPQQMGYPIDLSPPRLAGLREGRPAPMLDLASTRGLPP